jgi:hypothetical protein
MRVRFFPAYENFFIAGICVVMALALLQAAGQLSHLLPAAAVVLMLYELTDEIPLFIIAALAMDMLLQLA